ncbi:unnamed protein product [Notodromas monacha]|uniref:Uncharacterized protein n=1 Tax=Notodromas monacha TaxID=399045 RepID=A0A7R9GA28_9CRUS|nr:unnamed protein product [Notodromas monacha]CAG0913564.1 unnamed protein product [Notodromas monacha]
MQALNRSANFAATTGRKFGDAVSKFMGYRDFEQWTSNWGDTAHLPCLPSPDSDKYLDNFRHISRTGELKSLAMFWHGNLQSYFLFFTMAGMHRDTASEFTEDAREYSCRLYDVLDMVRNLLVQMEMKTEFKLLQPPPSECMQSACKFNVDPFHRLAISLRDSVSLLSDVRRRIDDFRLYYDDDRDASTDTTRS